MEPNGSQGMFASIARKPSSRTAALLFRKAKISSRFTGGEACNRKGALGGAGSGGVCAGTVSGVSTFSAGLSGDCDRNRWETSSNPRASRFSVRRFSSREASALSFRCKSKLLRPSALAQKFVKLLAVPVEFNHGVVVAKWTGLHLGV